MDSNELTGTIICCAIEVHRALGPGLLESAYEQCLKHELASMGVPFIAQPALPIEYKGLQLDCGYRLDLIVDDRMIVELKSVERLRPIHEAQLLTYMKLAKLNLGLLINFNELKLKDGVRRFVL